MLEEMEYNLGLIHRMKQLQINEYIEVKEKWDAIKTLL